MRFVVCGSPYLSVVSIDIFFSCNMLCRPADYIHNPVSVEAYNHDRVSEGREKGTKNSFFCSHCIECNVLTGQNKVLTASSRSLEKGDK
jgi:hypothetical protein